MSQGVTKTLILFVISAASIPFLPAETVSVADPNLPVTLQEYLIQAGMNNSGLRISFEGWKAALEQIPQAASLDDPQFTFSYFLREEMKNSSSPHEQRYEIVQMFPWFGKLESRTDAVAAQAKAAYHRYEAAKVKLVYQTSSVFHEFAYLGKAVNIAAENVELVKHFEQVTREKYRTAERSHPDIILAQIELATIEDDLVSIQQMRRPVIAQLNAIMNQPADRYLPWPNRDKFTPVELNRQVIAEQIRSANPELSVMGQQIIATRKMETLAHKRYWPDISLGIQYENMPNNGSDNQSPIMAMVSINLPIWTDNYKAGVRQAQSESAMARREKIQMEFDLQAQAEQIIYEMEDNLRKVRLYENILIPKAKQMIDASEQAYRTGSVDFLSLLDAQKKYLNFQLMHQRALTNCFQKQAELEMLTGKHLTTEKTQ